MERDRGKDPGLFLRRQFEYRKGLIDRVFILMMSVAFLIFLLTDMPEYKYGIRYVW